MRVQSLPIPMEIYFGTILVEANRWKSAPPSAVASPWVARALAAGFDGIELWERHYLDAEAEERAALRDAGPAITVYNGYTRFDAGSEAGRTASLGAITELAAAIRGVKFNLGRNADAASETAEAGRFLASLPPGIGFWCECHDGTVLETPVAAAPAFAAWGARSGAILHPVGMDEDRMRAWFDAAGGRVPHLHLQARGDDGRFTALRNRPEAVVAAFGRLAGLGFQGSATLEFTTGVAVPGEDPERTFESAVADLEFLRREVGA